MKKVKSIATLLLASTSLILFTGCIKKVENTKAAETGKATVKGRVQAQLNTTSSSLEPLANSKVYVFVNTKDYAQNPASVVYPLRRFETITDAKGDFILENLDVPLNGVSVSVTIPGFITDVITNSSGATERTVFSETSVSFGTAKDGSVLVKDIVVD